MHDLNVNFVFCLKHLINELFPILINEKFNECVIHV